MMRKEAINKNKALALILCISILLQISSCTIVREKNIRIDENINKMLEYLGCNDCYILSLSKYSRNKKKPYEVTQDEVDKVIEKALYQNPSKKVLDKEETELGDLVVISYEIINGENVLMSVDQQVVRVGNVNFDSTIEQSVEGRTVGKTYSIKYTNPKINLKDVVCNITPLYIYSLEITSLSDSFVKRHFQYNSVDEWKIAIRKDLEREKQEKAWVELLDEIIALSSFSLNEDVLIKQATNLVYQEEIQAMSENITIDEYVGQNYGMTKAEFYTECYLSCQRDIQEYLIIGAIASAELLQATQQDVDKYCTENNISKENLSDEDKSYMIYYILREKVINLLISEV